MELNLTYPEISLLRSTLRTKRHDMFLQLLKRSKKAKSMSMEELHKHQRLFNEEKNPHCEEGLVNNILEKIEDIEDTIQNETALFPPPTPKELRDRRKEIEEEWNLELIETLKEIMKCNRGESLPFEVVVKAMEVLERAQKRWSTTNSSS